MQGNRTTRGWRKTIRLKHLLGDDDSPENARKVAGQVAAILKRQREYVPPETREFDDEFSEIADELGELSETLDGGCADFNAILSVLYDWADDERVWIG
jgi:hypothetical protein